MITCTQLVADSNFTLVKKKLFPAFIITSWASFLQGLKATPECASLIFLINEGKIESILTITLRVPVGDSFRHSYSRGRRTDILISVKAVGDF